MSVENRLNQLEERLSSLEARLDAADQRETTLLLVLSWLLAQYPDNKGGRFLIDQSDELEKNPAQAEKLAAFEALIDLLGRLYALPPEAR